MTSQEIVTIISAVGIVLVNLVVAWRASTVAKYERAGAAHKADSASQKLDEIHEQTNSNLTTVKADLAIANNRIEQLESLLVSVSKIIPVTADET